MDSNSVVIITSLITAFAGKEAWGFYRRRAILKAKEREQDQSDEVTIKKELRELLDKRIQSLETDLDNLKKENALTEKELNELTVKNAILTERLLNYSQKSRGSKNKRDT